MSDVNVQLVREFFELNGFHVMTYWPREAVRPRAAEHGLQLLVENTAHVPERVLETVLRTGDIPGVARALVEVRAWHADRIYPSDIESNPGLFQMGERESLMRARTVTGKADIKTILVISELPASHEPRQRVIHLLESSGIDHVLEFPAVLHGLLDRISANVSYAPSQTLQTLRLLKRYDLIRRQQLEFPFPTEAPVSATPSLVDAVEEPEAVEND